MRDPDRIELTLKVLADIWNRYPDLRLGQIIDIAYRRGLTANGRKDPFDPDFQGPDLFSIEDDLMLAGLTEFNGSV